MMFWEGELEGIRNKGGEGREGNRDNSPTRQQIEHRVKRVGPTHHSHPERRSMFFATQLVRGGWC